MPASKIYISPIFDPWYYEFYIKGLHTYYGKDNISFSFEPRFLELLKYSYSPFRKDFFYYEIHENNTIKKIVIAADDKTDVNKELYELADVYAKVNVDEQSIAEYPLLFPIGPNFGIRFFSIFQYLRLVYSLKKRGIKNPYTKTFFKLSLKRQFVKVYTQGNKTNQKFIFYVNYPWKKHSDVTDKRKQIISTLQALDKSNIINFEGGFSRRRVGPFVGLEAYSAKRRYSSKKYLDKIKESVVVINTPAVHNCLGWKLGEYLALAKPIITLPINRIMPGEFINEKHYYEITSIDKLQQAIETLIDNKELLQELSENTKKYYNSYLVPEKVIERIHNSAIASVS